MNSLDLKDLYGGLITVILLVFAVGQYDHLRAFAKKEFIHAMENQHTVHHGDIEVLR